MDGRLPSPVLAGRPCMVGIDEAGRGPVLGPMVYGICVCAIDDFDQLKKCGFNDSKALTENERDRLFSRIKELSWLGWSVDVLSADYLSWKMLSRTKESLNTISHNSAIGLIRRVLAAKIDVQEVYVDTVGPPGKYVSLLKECFPAIEKIVVESKADATYPIVSAASICAKVIRDSHIVSHSCHEGDYNSSYGSGYPSDPTTKAWLSQTDPIFGYPDCVRFSWETTQRKLEAHAVRVEWNDPSDENIQINNNKRPKIFKDCGLKAAKLF